MIRPRDPRFPRLSDRTLALLALLAPIPVLGLPPAPSGLTGLPPSNGRANLAWSPDLAATPAVTAYGVSRTLLDSVTPTPTGTGAATPTALATVLLSSFPAPGTPVFQDLQVTNGRSYLYRVWGIDASGPGPAAAVTVSPFLQAAAVQPVTVRALRNDALDLSWGIPNSSYPISVYQVYRYDFLTTTPTLSPTASSTGTLGPSPTAPPSATPTFTLMPTPIPISTLVGIATPVGTTTTNAFSDATARHDAALAYYYYVLAVDSVGNPGALPTFSTNPADSGGLQPPFAPALSAQVDGGAYGVTLSWPAALVSEQVASYQVLRNGVTITSVPYVPGPAVLGYLDAAAPETSQAVTYQLLAVNPYGATASNRVLANILPGKVAGITVTPNPTSTSVVITWGLASWGSYPVTAYEVYKRLGGPPPGDPTALASWTQTPTPFAVVAIDLTVTPVLTPVVDSPAVDQMGYWVLPVDSMGGKGTAGVATPSTLRLAPGAPTGLVAGLATPGGNNRMALGWVAGSDGFFGVPDHYQLYRSVLAPQTPVNSPTPGGPTWTPTWSVTPVAVATVPYGTNGTLDVVSGFTTGSTVVYSLTAVDALGNQSTQAQASTFPVLPAGLGLPSPPQVLPFTGSDQSIQFAWLGNPGADAVTNVEVFGSDWSPVATQTTTPIAQFSSPATVMTFAPTPVPWDANRYYLVAQNATGDSQPATLSGIPVGNYQVTAVVPAGSRSVSLSWPQLPPATVTPSFDAYRIYRSLAPLTQFTPVATVSYPTQGCTDVPPVATAGVRYYYRVDALSSATGSESPLVPALTPDPMGQVLIWPNPPSGVTVLSGAGSTTLAWTGNASSEQVSSYLVYWNGSPTPIATILSTQSPTPTYAFVPQGTPGEVSVYQLAAVNPSGEGFPGQAVSVLSAPSMTPVVALTPPATFTPVGSPTPGVWISGLAYSGAVTGFEILHQNLPTPGTPSAYQAVGSVPFPNVSFGPVTAFTAGSINHYKVVAQGMGLSADPALSADLSLALWPAPPLISLDGSGASLVVALPTPSGDAPVTQNTIFRSLYPTLTPVLRGTSVPPATSWVDPAVTPGNLYVYWASAQNASGDSGLSGPRTIACADPPVVALTPLAFRNQLVWSPIPVPPNGPVTGYQVFRAALTPGLTPLFTPVALVEPLSNTSYSESSPGTSGVTYLYRVAASTQNGIWGPFSNAVTQRVFPSPVTNLIASSGDSLVQLHWENQGDPAAAYWIEKKLGSAPDASFSTLKGAFLGTSLSDTAVVNKDFYVYRIWTLDLSAGLTSVTAAEVVALPAKPPVVPSGTVSLFQNTNNAQTLIGNTLVWQAADPPGSMDPATMYPLGGYDLYRSTDGGGVYRSVGTLSAGSVPASGPITYFDEADLLSGSAFTYLVQAYDAPPDLPVPLAQAATQGWVHKTGYDPVTAYPISPSTALDRNAIRPFGGPEEQGVNIRFVVTSQGHVNIKVYGLGGNYITELVNDDFSPGIHWTRWDGRNRSGNLVASGVYLITTESPGHQEFSKVAVIK